MIKYLFKPHLLKKSRKYHLAMKLSLSFIFMGVFELFAIPSIGQNEIHIASAFGTVSDYPDHIIKGTDLRHEVEYNQRQGIAITGVVTESSGDPLPGVAVTIKGTSAGIITDADGKFNITAPDGNAVLVFSYIGYLNKEITVGNQSQINVTMTEDTKQLEEVVVIGYGTTKKRDVIGSIATVKSDAFETPGTSTDVLSLLQGQAAGLSVQSSSGRLGDGPSILVRGMSSISAGTSPLYIIDGVPIVGSMTMINQTDIESIEVLKDAAATSIYGSRGSNGVILITSKSGASGKLSVNFDSNYGITSLPFQQVKLTNTKQYFELLDFSKSTNSTGLFDMETDYYSSLSYITEKLTREQALNTNTDWKNELMRTGSFQNYNLTVTGGNEIAKYFVSTNYRKDNGVVKNNDLERYGVRINIDMKPKENFAIGIRTTLNMSNRDWSGAGTYITDLLTSSFLPVYSLESPEFYLNPKAGSNPAATNDRSNNYNEQNRYRALVGAYAEYFIPFVKGLSARTELSMDFQQENNNSWASSLISADDLASATDRALTSKVVNYNFYFTYNKEIGDHSFNLVGGLEGQKSDVWTRNMEGKDLVGNYQELGDPNIKSVMSSSLTDENYRFAYFGRANYKLKDRYLVGFSMRRDGTSVFTPEYRWGNFMAFSAGWIISDELFMGDFGKNHFLKVRGSYGQTGNSNIRSKMDANNYKSGFPYGSSEITATNGTLLDAFGVRDLTWETTNNFDVGVDYGFFKNRINGSIAYYNKYVEGLLLAVVLPPSAGMYSTWSNIGDLVNSGIELSVSSMNITSQNFKWQTSFNISFNRNRVKKLTPELDQNGRGMVESSYLTKVGSGVRDYYIADFAGIDTQTGLAKIYALDNDHYNKTGETIRRKDANGDYVLLNANTSNVGANYFHFKNKNGIPKYYGGITNTLTYKSFDLNFLITFSGGNYIHDQYMNEVFNGWMGTMDNLPMEYYDNIWKKPGDNAKYMRPLWKGNVYKDENGNSHSFGNSRGVTTQFLYKGDYVKLKSFTLGYTLTPKSSGVQKIFQQLRVYASFENLFTLTDYPGWDPEGQGRISNWVLPQLFSASIGLSVKF